MGDASPSVPLHQVCLVLSIAPSLYLVLLSHCTSSVTILLPMRFYRWRNNDKILHVMCEN